MRRRLAVAVVALGITMAVAGCTSPTAQPQADSTTPAAASSAPPAATSTPSPSPSETPIDPVTLPPSADLGPRAGAEGTVIHDDAGNPVGYVVAKGDTTWGIAARFGVSVDDMMDRANVGYSTIYPGEKLSLVW
ncbi:LysM domain-containing protein [Gryllotalpicola koreensis]|uniref:LysM domain-containing protein n=1 Tax=Gryllotalpicola koreensis TaxID=993086 RepID=A0ABP7ZYM5_9MICO